MVRGRGQPAARGKGAKGGKGYHQKGAKGAKGGKGSRRRKKATTSGDDWNERGQWFQVWRYWGEMEDIFCSAKGVWQAKGAGGSAATQSQQSYPTRDPPDCRYGHVDQWRA